MSEWDGKVVISTPGGQLIEMSLGEYVARKNAEVERLRAALRDIDALDPDVPDALAASDLRAIVAQMGDLAFKALEGKP
jgi:hypothetical protein